MANQEETDTQNRVKNIEQAKIDKWLGVFLFLYGLTGLYFVLRKWMSAPSTSHALDVVFVCCVLPLGAFVFCEGERTLQSGGKKYESSGRKIIPLLVVALMLVRGIYQHCIPVPGTIAAACVMIVFRMRRARRAP